MVKGPQTGKSGSSFSYEILGMSYELAFRGLDAGFLVMSQVFSYEILVMSYDL